MSEFVKKTMIGYKEVPGGQSDPECSHVILTLKEYEGLLQKISQAEQETRNEKRRAEEEKGLLCIGSSRQFKRRTRP